MSWLIWNHEYSLASIIGSIILFIIFNKYIKRSLDYKGLMYFIEYIKISIQSKFK